MKQIEQKTVNLCMILQSSIYPRCDDESIYLIENYKKWVSENKTLLPTVFLETWNDILDLERKLKNVKQNPNSPDAIEEVVSATANCNKKLSITIKELKNNQGY